MTTKPNTPPNWFSTEIRTGLATLYALSLDGCPAADVLAAAGNLWSGDLWADRRCEWHESDVPRIRAAFQRLRSTSRRWPQMADFWTMIPSRESSSAPALPPRVFTPEERARNLERLRQIGLSLVSGGGDK